MNSTKRHLCWGQIPRSVLQSRVSKPLLQQGTVLATAEEQLRTSEVHLEKLLQ